MVELHSQQPVVDNVTWMSVDACPACNSPDVAWNALLPDSAYLFGEETISFPSMGISLAMCAQCGLSYKTTVPTPASLAHVFSRQAGKKWMEVYDFTRDLDQLRQVIGTEWSDILDIGASSGGLLKACTDMGIKGRRSALDVMMHPGLEKNIAGEFIQGFLDFTPLQWSGVPYDVVTVFDLAEHLYNPQVAFQNLRELVKDGGVIFMETGNIESPWPAEFGPAEWWYVRLLEHHIFWSRRSLEAIVERNGFQIISCKESRHKSRVTATPFQATRDILKVGLYCAAPKVYFGLADKLGKWKRQPWSPFARDHLRVCLRKV